MTITKTASRNVAFKAAKISERILESQDEFIMRKPVEEEIESENDRQAALDDISVNADLYIYYCYNQVAFSFKSLSLE